MTEGLRVPSRLVILGLLVCTAVVLAGGCPPENYPDLVPTTLTDIDRIASDAALTVQEKRAQLAELGLSSLTINAILQGERLGNQDGGDLRTAYQKVTHGRLTELTPDEIQVYADEASAVAGFAYSLDDPQGQAVASFLTQYDLDVSGELSAFLDAHAEQVPETIPEGFLSDVFVDFDPQQLLTKLP